MSTVPDPTGIHWPEMIDNQEKHTVFLKPLVTLCEDRNRRIHLLQRRGRSDSLRDWERALHSGSREADHR
jgi:hypothetical protein